MRSRRTQWKEKEQSSELPVKIIPIVVERVDDTYLQTNGCSCQCSLLKSDIKVQSSEVSSNNSKVYTSSEFLTKVKSKDFSPRVLLRTKSNQQSKVKNWYSKTQSKDQTWKPKEKIKKKVIPKMIVPKKPVPKQMVFVTNLKNQSPKKGKLVWIDKTKVFPCVTHIKTCTSPGPKQVWVPKFL